MPEPPYLASPLIYIDQSLPTSFLPLIRQPYAIALPLLLHDMVTIIRIFLFRAFPRYDTYNSLQNQLTPKRAWTFFSLG
jgi:hypothetical protein